MGVRPNVPIRMVSSKADRLPTAERTLTTPRLPARAATLTRRLSPVVYLGPAALVYGLFVLWPLLHVLILSFERWDGYGRATFVGWSNYASLWADPGFADELRHSLLWLGVTLIVPVLLGLSLALLAARAPSRSAGICRAFLLTPLLLPSAVIAVIWKLIYTPLHGMLNIVLGTVGLNGWEQDWLGDPDLALGSLLVPACWASFGLSLLVFGAALAMIGRETWDAALIDGAGPWARFRYLTIPQLRRLLPLAVVATALCAVPSFDLVSLLTNGGPGYATTTLELDMEGRAFGLGQVGLGAALACVAALFGLLLGIGALAAARGYEQGSDQGVGSPPLGGRRPRLPARLTATGGLVVGTLLILLPVAWLVIRSLQIDPGEAGFFANLGTVWSAGFGRAFVTSALIGITAALGTLLLAFPAAFALHRSRSAVLRMVGVVMLTIGLFQPIEVLIIPLFTLLRDLGLLNSVAGVILPEISRGIPLAVLLLWGALRGVPSAVLHASEVDGAAPRQTLWFVALPLVMPMLLIVALWSFLWSWEEYLLPTIVMQDDSLQTVPVELGYFMGRMDTQYALIATGALLTAGPLLLAYGAGYGVFRLGLRRLRLG
jgi:raffinose/stachyose/melibiose transport system permease protein